MNIGANEGASDQELRIVFFQILSFFCIFTNINNLSIHAHVNDCRWPGSKSSLFYGQGFIGGFSRNRGYHIILVRTSSTANSSGVAE